MRGEGELRKYLFLSLSFIILVLDRITKKWIVDNFYYFERRRILGDFLRLTYTRNPYGVFGIPLGGRTVSLILTFCAFVFVVYLFIISKEKFLTFSLSLIIGGAMGNLWDRLREGSVIDFIDVGIGRWRWPTFNIADSFVTIGIILAIFCWLFEERKKGACSSCI